MSITGGVVMLVQNSSNLQTGTAEEIDLTMVVWEPCQGVEDGNQVRVSGRETRSGCLGP